MIRIRPYTRGFVCCCLFLCFNSGLEAAEELSWDQKLTRRVSPRWREAGDRLRKIEADLALLPVIPIENSGGTGGMAAFFPTPEVPDDKPVRIFEVLWAEPVLVDLVALVPARKYYVDGVAMDYGLPEEFSVELISENGLPVFPVAVERAVRGCPVRNGHPFVYDLPKPVLASGLRVTVARLKEEVSEDDVSYVMAFSEVFCFSGNRNVATHAKVQSNFKLLDPSHWFWRSGFLIDGLTPLGLPEFPATNHQEIGWLSRDRARDDVPAWVTIDLGQPRQFDGVRMYPIRRPAFGDLPGFGLPVQFFIDVFDEDYSVAPTRVLNHMGRDLKNPGYNPVDLTFPPITARFIRVEARTLWKQFDNYPAFFGFSEIEILDGANNIAQGASATSSDEIGRIKAHGKLFWSEESLTDGHGPRGVLVQPRAWLLGLKTRFDLEMQQYELKSEMESIALVLRHWVVGISMVVGGGGIFFSIFFPIRSRLLRRREIHRVRERIAGDLHDEVGSNLGSIQILSDLAQQQQPESDELKTIQRVAAETVTAVRDIVWLLRARTAQRVCVADHLNETGAILLESMDWTFVVDDGARNVDLSDDRIRDLMLFYREALHNLVRHANARTVAIRLGRDGECLILTISDDGYGILPEILNRPITLRALKQRAERLNGRLEVCSEQDKGTTLSLYVPMSA